MKILIIEDDQTLANNFQKIITGEGFAADIANTRETGTMQLEINQYDCIILDINLPDGNGFDVLNEMRKEKNETPVIIITARGQTEERVKGLNLGADDYIPKPIDSNELIARIRAVIRRSSAHPLPVVSIGELTVTPAKHLATIGKTKIDFTGKEFAVLEYLAHHTGQVVTRSMLMEHIWGSDFDTFSNVIDVYIRCIRRKLEKHTKSKLVKTIRGKGYILDKNGV